VGLALDELKLLRFLRRAPATPIRVSRKNVNAAKQIEPTASALFSLAVPWLGPPPPAASPPNPRHEPPARDQAYAAPLPLVCELDTGKSPSGHGVTARTLSRDWRPVNARQADRMASPEYAGRALDLPLTFTRSAGGPQTPFDGRRMTCPKSRRRFPESWYLRIDDAANFAHVRRRRGGQEGAKWTASTR
jgi:hypothetical protein